MSRLDSGALIDLERRALNLQALFADGARIIALPELEARHRVFAAVVAATRENLAVLERVGAPNPYGTFGGGDPWAL